MIYLILNTFKNEELLNPLVLIFFSANLDHNINSFIEKTSNTPNFYNYHFDVNKINEFYYEKNLDFDILSNKLYKATINFIENNKKNQDTEFFIINETKNILLNFFQVLIYIFF